MKRLLIVFNPRSSRFSDVKKEVLNRYDDFKGYIVGKYEVKPTNLKDNIKSLSKILEDGDLVISAGGDATGIIASSSILNSKKDARLAILPYGNFNDFSRTLKTATLDDALNGKTITYYPLEVYVNDKFWRYATCYVTIGMTAAAVSIYDKPKMRQKLKKSIGRKIGSYTQLVLWYFKNRKKQNYLPEFKLNGKLVSAKNSDYAAVNSHFMARVMKGGEDYKNPKVFHSEIERTTNFYYLFKLMAKSILTRIPGSETKEDILEFTNPAKVTIQTEGESELLENVKTIKIKKSSQSLKVITKD